MAEEQLARKSRKGVFQMPPCSSITSLVAPTTQNGLSAAAAGGVSRTRAAHRRTRNFD